MLKRTFIGRLMECLADYQVRSKYKSLEEKGTCNLESAVNKYPKVTLFSSHINKHDIGALDISVRRILGNENFPVFVMRSNLQVKIGKWYLSLELSQKLYSEHCCALPVDQKDVLGMDNIMPQIKQVYDSKRVLAIFPGATRHFGFANGLIPIATAEYVRKLKKNNLDKDHCFVPVAINYKENEYVKVSYGSLISLEGAQGKTIGQQVADVIAELSGTKGCGRIPARDVLDFVKERD